MCIEDERDTNEKASLFTVWFCCHNNDAEDKPFLQLKMPHCCDEELTFMPLSGKVTS